MTRLSNAGRFRPRDGTTRCRFSNPILRRSLIRASPVLDAKAEPTLKYPESEAFYAEALRRAERARRCRSCSPAPTRLSAYTGITRPTKDLDIFCKAGDYTRVLSHFKILGYAVEIEDERWLGKVFKGQYFFDVIFASSNGTMPIGDHWFEKRARSRSSARRCASSGRPSSSGRNASSSSAIATTARTSRTRS